jgi:hypothetical protein
MSTSVLCGSNVPETILFCVDVHSDVLEEGFSESCRKTGLESFPTLTFINDALRIFVASKTVLNSRHRFGLVKLTDRAEWAVQPRIEGVPVSVTSTGAPVFDLCGEENLGMKPRTRAQRTAQIGSYYSTVPSSTTGSAASAASTATTFSSSSSSFFGLPPTDLHAVAYRNSFVDPSALRSGSTNLNMNEEVLTKLASLHKDVRAYESFDSESLLKLVASERERMDASGLTGPLRVVVVYARSSIAPSPVAEPSLRAILVRPDVFADCMFLYCRQKDKVVAKRVYEALVNVIDDSPLVRGYCFSEATSLSRFFRAMGILQAHPLQRPPQSAWRLTTLAPSTVAYSGAA